VITATATPAAAASRPSSWYGLPTTMSITVPQVYVGVPATLTATLSNSVVTGGVQFWANDPAYGLGPIVPAANGRATFTFMPGPDGVNQWQTFGATFWPDINQGTTDATAATVTMRVLPNNGPDTLMLTPSGFTLGNGQSQAITITSASGAQNAVQSAGGCALTNGILTGTAASGTCSVFASTTGTRGYLPASTGWAIPLSSGVQTARITAPKSGTLAKGSSLILGSASQRTNAGEPITWRVASGSKTCSLATQHGSVVLRTGYTGRCTAVASAPAHSPEYGEFTASRTYRVVIPG